MAYWQFVLIDDRPDRSILRWPGSWQPGRDYLHRTGPVRQRGRRGLEYLTNDAVYVDLAKLICFRPDTPASPMGRKPSSVVKRLYPLDPHNRTFVVSVVFRLAGVLAEFEVKSEKPTTSPVAMAPYTWGGWDDNLELECSASDFAAWGANLNMRVRASDDAISLHDIGDRVADHLAAVTSRGPESSGKVRCIGQSLFIQALMLRGPHQSMPNLIVDCPPDVPGRPFIAVAGLQSPRSLERRLRTFTLRTFAEVQVANHLYGALGREPEQLGGWVGIRAAASIDYLSRPMPSGFDGEVARRIWQLSVSRRGQSFGRLKATTRDRLADMIGPRTDQAAPGNVMFVTNSGDNHNYYVGQAGSVGPNARGNVINMGGAQIDLRQLGVELTQLSQSLRAEHPDDAALIAEAAQDAANGDAQAVESKLKRLSRRAGQVALELGLAIAGAVIAHAGGLA